MYSLMTHRCDCSSYGYCVRCIVAAGESILTEGPCGLLSCRKNKPHCFLVEFHQRQQICSCLGLLFFVELYRVAQNSTPLPNDQKHRIKACQWD